MSTQLIERYESFSLAANDRKIIAGQFDFVYFEALPAGVTVSINGEPHRARQEGSIRAGVPGRDDIVSVEFLNTTGGALAVAALFGNGSFEISGQVSLVGSIALPTGASTAARQDTGNATLGSILAGLAALATSALQTTGNALLTTISTTLTTATGYLQLLANPTARFTRFVNFTGGGGSLTIAAGARSLDILNTHESLAITVQVTGQAAATLAAGKGVAFPLVHPRDTGHEEVTISGAAGATANVAYVL